MTDTSRSPLVKASAAEQVSNLIQMLENAKGPSGELDIEIYKLEEGHHTPASSVQEFKVDHHGIAMWRVRHEGQTWGSWWTMDSYTGSIDSALTLVPYQREWHVGSVTLLGTFWAEIVTPTERHIGKGARTPAIALCIAALKAREASR